ncbi:hypothetical protein BN873_980028 [Candidatus Competibacter denitrificans Run_A_D11]|uniref:Uncharacterized protein n=1 Tax=Candidatus Competibacter denitrificans Run_A_D11 TaxID=1400863 RepID=W6M9U1_9GAMM|nr:hypothetical protein BN873_980028 [Candidatus Competibacter denitrificans Run_A_D11]
MLHLELQLVLRSRRFWKAARAFLCGLLAALLVNKPSAG